MGRTQARVGVAQRSVVGSKERQKRKAPVRKGVRVGCRGNDTQKWLARVREVEGGRAEGGEVGRGLAEEAKGEVLQGQQQPQEELDGGH